MTSPEMDALYARCPHDDFVAPPSTMNYSLAVSGDLDPARPIDVTCFFGHAYAVTAPDILPHDTTLTCVRSGCGADIPVPATADQVVCLRCRLHQPGPRQLADLDRANYIDRLHAAWLADVRAAIAAAHGPRPPARSGPVRPVAQPSASAVPSPVGPALDHSPGKNHDPLRGRRP